MDLYNLDLKDVRLLLALVEREEERVLTAVEESVGQPNLPQWQAKLAQAKALRQRLAAESLHASQGR